MTEKQGSQTLQDPKDPKKPAKTRPAGIRRAIFECVDERCKDNKGERSRDVLKLFPEEQLPRAVACYQCHGGLQGTGPGPQPGGMQFVAYETDDEAGEGETGKTVH